MAQIFRKIALLGACFLAPACGGDDGGPSGPVQTMPPAVEGIPPRASTHEYQPAYSFAENRSLSGIGYERISTATGETYPDGQRVFVSTVTFSDRPNGLFEYDATQRSAFFEYDGVVATAVDNGTNFQQQNGGMLWYEPFIEDPYSIRYAGHPAGSGSRYIAYAEYTYWNEDGAEVVQRFAGGSRTRSDDLPPRGHDFRTYSLYAQVLGTEAAPPVTGSGRGNADFDYGEGRFSGGTVGVDFDGSDAGPELELAVSGTLTRRDASWKATVTDKASGATAVLRGSCYGPYCEAILLEGLLVLKDGRQAILTAYM